MLYYCCTLFLLSKLKIWRLMKYRRIKRDPKTVALAQQIIDTYNPQSPKDMGEALTAIFGSLFESMLQGKMNNHLGYSSIK